jgi:hypothetical protein
MDQISQGAVFIFGLFTGFIGFMFDVPAATLWTAAVGSMIGIAIRPPISMREGGLLVIGVTVAIGLAVPLALYFLPEGLPQKSVSALLAVFAIGGRNLLPTILQEVMTEFGETCKRVIRAMGDRMVLVITTIGTKKTNGSGDPKP